MKLHQDTPAGFNRFTGYGEGYVLVNGERFEGGLIVFPEQPVLSWEASFDTLESAHFQIILDASPEILILGTGRRQRFPEPSIFRQLYEARIGVEVMDSPAAARTYNILMGEGRQIAAAIITDRQAS
ncbi:MAG TPA: Mth938-like domain-containing protein [Burkholderiales bacterium]|nr:Mth938-like domain-containing protein [Burkholderiales bacterium]